MIWAAEAATAIGIIPLLWLSFLHWRGKACDVAWWWLAGAFLVSWVADNASRWVGHPMASVTYPVLQAGIIGAVFLFRADAIKLVLVLMLAGIVDVLWWGVQGPDVLLRSVAWLSVVAIVYPLRQLERLRAALLVYFAGGWIAWMCYAADPGWGTWIPYQLVRLIGILLFCAAASDPRPHFKLSTRT